MTTLDWLVLSGYFLVMLGIGLWAKGRIHSVADYFTARGMIPWWLSGISHHMSGYSAIMFVAFAAVAYTYGLAMYVWWALTIGLGVGIGAFLFAARWNRLRSRHGVASPLEYLARRYNVPTQQVLAYSGALLKVVDIAAKWVAIAVLLRGFAGVPILWGIVITGAVTLVYITAGGLWADVLTDFGQFVIQGVAGVAMFLAFLGHLGGVSALWNMWDDLPAGHGDPFHGPYTLTFFLALLFIKTFEYNGGMWNLAQRYMAAPSGSAAKRSALLSSALWLVWPLILFMPMFAAPLIVPGLTNPEQAYVELAKSLLPPGVIGLVLAGFFSHTMAMVSSDANVISSVVTRDIAPVLVRAVRHLSERGALTFARITTFAFVAISMVIAISTEGQGVVLKIVVDLVAATMGPISIPLMLGLLPWFRRCGPTAAIASWAAGLGVWVVVKWILDETSQTMVVGVPLVTSLVLYTAIGLLKPERTMERDTIIDSLDSDPADEARPVTTA
ncbi:sodium:solute symporter family protein [Actinoplanes teichomyceticus]|uniref:Na+/proline symporter n=1 Tax=Actinoplanes teichomyceticus TaxID=1867 RepID=A0A561WKP1_ACTTI|nr:sodium:solute symporter family protein [Actinoplanes teichomyceticus]TWG24431.1 Na+/proline symporter [Actinoplanes teichomyceticus]GIF12719.1 sodium-coupled permease [Actinoplanes teichomyceticus]